MTQPPDPDIPQTRASEPPATEPYAAGQPYGAPGQPHAEPGQPYGATGQPAAAGAYAQAAAPAVPAGMYLDQASGLVLPQGTQLASAGRRIGAYFLAIPLAIVTLGIGYIIWGLIVWARGQTPALQVLGMRCWRTETQTVPGFWWMALREVAGRIVEGILGVITALISLILMLTRADRRTLHDLIAGTVVLHDPGKVLASRSPSPPAGAEGGGEPALPLPPGPETG